MQNNVSKCISSITIKSHACLILLFSVLLQDHEEKNKHESQDEHMEKHCNRKPGSLSGD